MSDKPRTSSLAALPAPTDSKAASKPPTASTPSEAALLEKLMSKLETAIEQKVAERLSVEAIKSLLPPPAIASAAADKDSKETPPGQGALSSLMAASGYRATPSRKTSAVALAEPAEDVASYEEEEPSQSSRGVDLAKPVASMLWTEEIVPFGSAISFVRMSQWNDKRNKHEAEALAWSLDAFAGEGLPTKSVSFEVQVRRLLGVKLADEHRDWALAEALAWKSGHGVQNRSLLRSLLKDRKSFVDLAKGPATKTRGSYKSAVAPSRGGGGRSGRGGRGRFHSSQQLNATQKPSSGSSDAAAR